MNSLGYRTMIAMIANFYFDNRFFAVLIHRLTLTPTRILSGITPWECTCSD